MLRILFTALLVASLPLIAFSQQLMRWGEVEAADLQMTSYPVDSTAAAAVLGDFGFVTFEFELDGLYQIFKRHRRVKILSKAGYSHADVELFRISDSQKYRELKAQIILPNGNRIALRKDDFFVDDASEVFETIKFTFPQVCEGAIIEFRYTLASKNTFNLPNWYFQEEIPVRFSQFSTLIPNWFRYVSINQVPADLGNTKNESIERQVSVAAGALPVYMRGIVAAGGSSLRDLDIEFQKTVQSMQEVPAYRVEPYMTSIEDYLPQVRMQLSAIQLPNRPAENLLNTWPKLAERLMESNYFGKQFSRKNKHKKLAEAILPEVEKASTDREKVAVIYDRINELVQWNGHYDIGVSNKLDDAFEKGEGNSGAINLMVLALLKRAGIEAYPVLVSTRDNGQLWEFFPLDGAFNHLMILVELPESEGGPIWVDAGQPLRALGLPRTDALNHRGWLVDPDQPRFVDIAGPKSKQVTMGEVHLRDDGWVEGTIRRRMGSYAAAAGQADLKAEEPHERPLVRQFLKYYPEAEVRTFDLQDAAPHLQVAVDCSVPAAEVIGDYMYLRPLLLPVLEGQLFSLAERTYPVDIPYASADHVVLTYHLPNGYVLEELPEDHFLKLTPEGLVRFTYSATTRGNQLIVKASLHVDRLQFAPEEYEFLKAFFDRVHEIQETQIVLRRSRT